MDVTPPPAPAAAPRKPPMPSEWLGGLGFLAALVAGALFYATARGRERPEFVTCASDCPCRAAADPAPETRPSSSHRSTP
jgi:hypothetical protein